MYPDTKYSSVYRIGFMKDKAVTLKLSTGKLRISSISTITQDATLNCMSATFMQLNLYHVFTAEACWCILWLLISIMMLYELLSSISHDIHRIIT
jgi:hypothetical protein